MPFSPIGWDWNVNDVDDAEVPAAASQCPEQVRVGGLAGGDEAAVGQDNIGRYQIVDREAVPAIQVTGHTSTEGQAAHPGGTDEASRDDESERHRGMVHLRPGAARIHAHRAVDRGEGDGSHQR